MDIQDDTAADRIITELGLAPHPEGGWFRETHRSDLKTGARATGTAIYYLLKAGERSHWHRVTDADEVWHWYAGHPLTLHIAAPGDAETVVRLGPDVLKGERPQAVVPANWWQSAAAAGDGWALVGCTVAPGFSFDAFEMAPPDWTPGGD